MLKHFYCVPKCFCRLDKSMGAVILNLINCMMFTCVCSEYAIIRLFTCSEYVIIRLFTCSYYAKIRFFTCSEYAIIRWNMVFLFCADFFLYNNESETEFFSSLQWLVQTRYSCFDVFPFSVSETVFVFSFLVVTRALGPVVQSLVSLTSSLRVISLTVLADSIYTILIFFAEKMWVAFALQKLLTFFQQKISAYLRITQCKF